MSVIIFVAVAFRTAKVATNLSHQFPALSAEYIFVWLGGALGFLLQRESTLSSNVAMAVESHWSRT